MARIGNYSIYKATIAVWPAAVNAVLARRRVSLGLNVRRMSVGSAYFACDVVRRYHHASKAKKTIKSANIDYFKGVESLLIT